MIVKIQHRTIVVLWFTLLSLVLKVSFVKCRRHELDNNFNNTIALVINSSSYYVPLQPHVLLKQIDYNNLNHDFVEYDNEITTTNSTIKSDQSLSKHQQQRSLQIDVCVRNEDELRLAVSNVSISRIDLCSSYIYTNTNSARIGEILINQMKNLSIYCMATVYGNNIRPCIIDAQHLSKMFAIYDSNVNFYDIHFINGNASKDGYTSGGGFYIQNSNINYYNCNFINNIGERGGGMMVFTSNITIIQSENITLPRTIIQNNIANFAGSFMEGYSSNILFQNVNFVNNTSNAYGGAIAFFRSNVTLIGSNNSTLPSLIRNNKALIDGGFIIATDQSIIVLKKYFIISNNNAGNNGGVICIGKSKLFMYGNDNNDTAIHNNTAENDGGFVQAYDNSFIEINKYSFINNTAYNGGVISVTDTTILKMYGNDNNTKISATRIENNQAAIEGGFLVSYNHAMIEINKYNFINNNAEYGGVISITQNSTLKIIGNNNTDTLKQNIIYHNVATIDGGFIYAYVNSTIMIDNYIFFNNTVVTGSSGSGNGDTFYVEDSTLTLKVRDDPTTAFEIEGNNINIL